jgi:hypothetical protein
MQVTHVNGTSDKMCPCGSWLEHWKRFSRRTLPACCPEARCIQPPEVGALIQRTDVPDRTRYIVPLCTSHNAVRGETLILSDYVCLVCADVAITCGKE